MKGQNLRITLGTKYVAYATSCTFHVSTSLEDSSTKDTSNDYTAQEVTGIAWDISCDALYSVATDATGVNGIDALDLVLAKNKVAVTFTQASGTNNRTPVTGGVVYSGQAWVNDISINAPNRQNVSYTIQLTGDGELTKTPASE